MVLSLIVLSPKLYCWNAIGHRIMAQITLDLLTADAKKLAERYNQALNNREHHYSFVGAASWLDQLRSPNDSYLGALHYINLPFTRDNTPLKLVKPPHAVSAITQAIAVLKNPAATMRDKGFSLRVLVHVVGDLHQPMHAVSEFSHQHPNGDYGGNLVRLKNNSVASNLHTYWDKGGGWLGSKKRYTQQTVKRRAKILEQRYPCQLADNLDPRYWAIESYQLARNKAYGLLIKQNPDKKYQQMTIDITKQRLAQAGCRLAGVLNQLVNN